MRSARQIATTRPLTRQPSFLPPRNKVGVMILGAMLTAAPATRQMQRTPTGSSRSRSHTAMQRVGIKTSSLHYRTIKPANVTQQAVVRQEQAPQQAHQEQALVMRRPQKNRLTQVMRPALGWSPRPFP